ncbi:hypothetical protein [Planctomyces sp. SH-PL14]|uniref:hypothetical protein n=1 Tax=Planctomyces sp. SH-PL14 TaxID=1632864 RepID=UPI00078B3935|nr:hypothetical protein [Planctomyces sp. SH-PL14]AMV19563.1 hypothetical protein VT03_16835 [Planctomyces sp. SH-PL14]
MSDIPTQLYLRLRGEVIGPLSSTEFDELRASGALQYAAEVSNDQATWRPVSGSKPRAPIHDVQKAPDAGCPLWFHALLAFSGFFLGTIFTLAFATALGAMTGAGEATGAPASTNATSEATWNYWNRAAEAVAAVNASGPLDGGLAEAMAVQLEGMSQTNVDPDVVQCVQSLITVTRQVIDHTRQNSVAIDGTLSPGRTSQLTPTSGGLPVQENVKALTNQIELTRSTLAQRYRRVFPSIAF